MHSPAHSAPLYQGPRGDAPLRRQSDLLKIRAQNNLKNGTLQMKKGLESFRAIGAQPQALIATLGLLLLLSLL